METPAVTIALNLANINNVPDFERRRRAAVETQKNGDDPNFELLLTNTPYGDLGFDDEPPQNAYDVATAKWLAAVEAGEASPDNADPRLVRAIGSRATYVVGFSDDGRIISVIQKQDLGEPSKARVAAAQRAQRTMNTGLTEINTPRFMKPPRIDPLMHC